MALYNDNLGNRILELLNYPVPNRCVELTQLFERCSLRELQDIFPTVTKSVFGIGSGGLGWGLRATTKENAPDSFTILRDFFSPLGAMLRLCYRLLNDAIKFEFNLDSLPHKVSEIIKSGQYSLFYADLVNIDPFRRQVCSLSLNAFDYYILHFVLHATFPLHKMCPAALQVHNERLKTVYFFLTADYLSAFLPGSADGMVFPANICNTVKAPQPMQPMQPVQPLQPQRQPKYLKIPSTNLFAAESPTTSAAAAQAARNCESPRTFAWRTESVLYFFVDTWLRYDVDEARDLPSSEFIRVVRLLVKQVHLFANVMHVDHTPMVTLRKIAQPLMKTRIYPFLKSIIARWPLDSSLSVVLELWLSYIQPWRYICDGPITSISSNNSGLSPESYSGQHFCQFIQENLVIYTQIFVHILPRFERLDFTSYRNAVMLHRLVKVFSQPNLAQILRQAEQTYVCSMGTDSPRRHAMYARHNKFTGEWDAVFHEEVYAPLFGHAIHGEIEEVLKTLCISRMYLQQEVATKQCEVMQQKKSQSFLRKMLVMLFDHTSPAEMKLQEIGKIPPILDYIVCALVEMFNLEMPDVTMEQMPQRDLITQPLQASFSSNESSDYLDISRISPMQMRSNLSNLSKHIDPATLPVQTHEVKFLVRFLHQLSCRLNEVWADELQSLWCRSDFVGKISRQLLYSPMKSQWFDKSRGSTQLIEEELPARICLRVLASYKTLGVILLSMCLGYTLWHAPIFGLFLLICIFTTVLLIKALMS